MTAAPGQTARERLRVHEGGSVTEPAVQFTTMDDTVRTRLTTARRVQAEWSGRSVRDRIRVLTSLRTRIAENPRGIASRVNREKAAETLAAEVLPLLDACRFLELESPRILREKAAGRRARPMWLWGTSVLLRPEPLGVVLVIGPSNYPLMLPGIQALQAIAAGNSVLVKPAANCSAAIQALVDVAESAGLPVGTIQVLSESPDAAAAAIRCQVDKVFLTGSAATGRAVSRELADSTTPSVMELSGCDAVFVLDDADPELVSDCLLFGLTLNNSQTCMAPRRVFASDSMADRVLQLLQKKILRRETADARSDSGPPSSSGILASVWPNNRGPGRDYASCRAAEEIGKAISGGARLLTGSVETGGSQPVLKGIAVLDRVTAGMSIAQSDLFAPVLSFLRVATDQMALHEHAKCPYALSATVFGSPGRSLEFARRVEAGCVLINDMIVPSADPRVPFGGRGRSGHGMTRGEAGLLEMTQLKAIVATRRLFRPHLHSPTPADADVLEQLICLEHAASPLRTLAIVPRLIRSILSQISFRRSQGVTEA